MTKITSQTSYSKFQKAMKGAIEEHLLETASVDIEESLRVVVKDLTKFLKPEDGAILMAALDEYFDTHEVGATQIRNVANISIQAMLVRIMFVEMHGIIQDVSKGFIKDIETARERCDAIWERIDIDGNGVPDKPESVR